MTDPLRIVESAPLGATPEQLSGIHLTLLSTLDPDRLETALTSALLKLFQAEACVLLGDEAASDLHRQLVQEAQTRGVAIRVDGAICAPLIGGNRAPATLIVERKPPFTREDLLQLAALAPPAALALRNARVFAKATTDDLTGLPNRQRFVVELEAAVLAEGPLSLILVDVDHFKDKNDVYGRPVGNRALAEMGELLRSLPVLAAARSGDDEFALLLGATAAPARDFAEDLRKSANDRIFDEQTEGIHLTISAGVAELRGGEMASALFGRASEALAASKREGRNRVTLAR